jgi:hypothetical protein
VSSGLPQVIDMATYAAGMRCECSDALGELCLYACARPRVASNARRARDAVYCAPPQPRWREQVAALQAHVPADTVQTGDYSRVSARGVCTDAPLPHVGK